MKKIRVLVVNDSSVVRNMLARELSACRGIEAAGTAWDPEGRSLLEADNAGVIVLDIDMRDTHGLSLLEYVVKRHPLPVIALSSFVSSDDIAPVLSLERGAVGVARKPGGAFSVRKTIEELSVLIRSVSGIPPQTIRRLSTVQVVPSFSSEAFFLNRSREKNCGGRLIVAGASTGGVTAFEQFLPRCAPDCPPVLAVTGLPDYVTPLFVKRLSKLCRMRVKEAENGEMLLPGTVYVAPGRRSVTVLNSGGVRTVHTDRTRFDKHSAQPVDTLFKSAAAAAGKDCTAVLLSGEGTDGALGMKAVRLHGGYTLAQSRETCVVCGMVGNAAAAGAVCDVVPAAKIAEKINGRAETLPPAFVVREEYFRAF